MAEVELSRAAEALKEHFGARVVGSRADGRDLMVSALMERLGLSKDAATEVVQALERAHSIEYVERGGAIGTIPQAKMPFAEAMGAENTAGPTTSAEVPLAAGYWRL